MHFTDEKTCTANRKPTELLPVRCAMCHAVDKDAVLGASLHLCVKPLDKEVIVSHALYERNVCISFLLVRLHPPCTHLTLQIHFSKLPPSCSP